ncbi:MAG: nucleotidyltransferase family protein [Kiloniellales bacterium]|nr:nucleotidyltransferase family protein [Kiloniellales bacterium]
MQRDRGKERFWRGLSDPARLLTLAESDWPPFLEAFRVTGTLGKTAAALRRAGHFNDLPPRVRLQLEELLLLVDRNQTDIRFELNRVLHALGHNHPPLIVLKGAAYLVAGLTPADGRFSSDLDVLVPRSKLKDLENRLLSAGWRGDELSSYDERYYREWMHEIPPLWHPGRGIAVDIHHTIAPLTGRASPDPQALVLAATNSELKGVQLLCPADMVLHSALHLFNEEFLMGLRDLTDIRDLLEEFAEDSGFWMTLADRARLHGLERQLFYLLRYTEIILECAPAGRPKELKSLGKPGPLTLYFMDLLILHAMTPPVGLFSSPVRKTVIWLLYLRSHWLKMPPLLLFKHFLVKSWRRWREPRAALSGKA